MIVRSVALIAFLWVLSPDRVRADPLDDCLKDLRRGPTSFRGYFCLGTPGLPERAEEVRQILTRRLAEHPRDAHARLYLALMRFYARVETSGRDFDETLAQFREEGDLEGEFGVLLARTEFRCGGRDLSLCEVAGEDVRRASNLADASGDPGLRRLAAVALVRWNYSARGPGLARQAEHTVLDALGSQPPPWLVVLELSTRSLVANALDEYPRQRELYAQLARVAPSGSVTEAAALAGYASATAMMSFLELIPRDEAIAAARQSLEAQRRLGIVDYNGPDVGVEKARDLLALLLGRTPEAMELVNSGPPGLTLVEYLSLGNQEERVRALSVAATDNESSPNAQATVLLKGLVLLRSGHEREGRRMGQAALRLTEEFLASEKDPQYRMLWESRTAGNFHSVASTLLQSSFPPSTESLEASLQALERSRAHSLLEALLARDDASAFGGPPTIANLQAALGPDEALVSFEQWRPLPTTFLPLTTESSWAIVVTVDGANAIPLPPASQVELEIKTWTGLLQQRDPGAAAGARRLHAELIAPVLARLPPTVRNLVLIPDGALHRLPFDALSATGAAPFLVDRYAVSIVPSAAVWLRLRARGGARPGPALALASGPGDTAVEHAVTRGEVDRGLLQPLARARDEASEAVRAFGSGSRMLVEDAATLDALRQVDLQRAALVHVAAHAVVDEQHPEESFLLLAPGASSSGKLRVGDIPSFDWSGKTVVLSACETSAGTMRRGEGVLSLARGFFAGGASTVIGTLGKVRDDEQYALFREFYSELRRGVSVGEALSLAKRTLIRRGAPPGAWANVVLLGDAAVRPHPPERWTDRFWWLFPAAAVLTMTAIGAAFLVHRQRHALG